MKVATRPCLAATPFTRRNVHGKTLCGDIGFCHEGCDEAMPCGDAFHEALVEDRVVGRAHRIVAMFEHDLELARRIFGNERSCGETHLLRAVENVVQEGRKIFQVLHEIGLEMRGRETVWCGWRHNAALRGRVAVDEIEFE